MHMLWREDHASTERELCGAISKARYGAWPWWFIRRECDAGHIRHTCSRLAMARWAFVVTADRPRRLRSDVLIEESVMHMLAVVMAAATPLVWFWI
jgi:hypothetical protein